MDRRSWVSWGLLFTAGLSGCLAGIFAGGKPEPEPAASNGWRLLDAVTYENLSVFPVVSAKAGETSGFLTLDEALASGDALVAEQGGDILRRTRDGRPVPMTG